MGLSHLTYPVDALPTHRASSGREGVWSDGIADLAPEEEVWVRFGRKAMIWSASGTAGGCLPGSAQRSQAGGKR